MAAARAAGRVSGQVTGGISGMTIGRASGQIAAQVTGPASGPAPRAVTGRVAGRTTGRVSCRIVGAVVARVTNRASAPVSGQASSPPRQTARAHGLTPDLACSSSARLNHRSLPSALPLSLPHPDLRWVASGLSPLAVRHTLQSTIGNLQSDAPLDPLIAGSYRRLSDPSVRSDELLSLSPPSLRPGLPASF